MAKGLRSKSAMTKDTTHRNEVFSTKLQNVQDQIQELVLESRLGKQER